MVKLEQGTSINTFKLNGLDYLKGTYEINYSNVTVDNLGEVDYEKLQIGLLNKYTKSFIQSPLPYFKWTDVNDVFYISYSDLINDLTQYSAIPISETDPIFGSSEASLFVSGDKAKLDNAWLRSGNAGTNPATDFIGTTDNQHFRIRTNNATQLELRTDGSTLLYAPAIQGGNPAFTNVGFNTFNANNNYRWTVLTNGTINVTSRFGGSMTTDIQGGGTNPFGGPSDAAGDYSIRTTPSLLTRFIVKNNGLVGINTTAPTKQLDINGELRIRTLPTGLNTENILVVNGSGDVRSITPSTFIQGNTWSLLGNSGTNPATNFIGTTDAQDLVFKRNNENTALFRTDAFSSNIFTINRDNVNNYLEVKRTGSNLSTMLLGAESNGVKLYVGGSSGFSINTGSSSDISTSTTKLIVTASGSLGLGVTSPARFFHVQGNDFVRFDRISATNGMAEIMTRMTDSSTVASSWIYGQPNAFASVPTDSFIIADYGTAVSGATANVRFLIHKTTGLVGINTATATKQLDINGELRIRTLPTGLSTENILVVNGSGDVRSVSIFVSPPATATSTGVAGQIAYDSSFMYICIATNTWRRVAIASW